MDRNDLDNLRRPQLSVLKMDECEIGQRAFGTQAAIALTFDVSGSTVSRVYQGG